jgi:hypothetical protein
MLINYTKVLKRKGKRENKKIAVAARQPAVQPAR